MSRQLFLNFKIQDETSNVTRSVKIEAISEQLGIFVNTQNCVGWPCIFKVSFRVGFHQDNARLHNVARTAKTICQLSREKFPNPSYCPNLDSYDFYFFGPFKEFLWGTKFSRNKDVKSTVTINSVQRFLWWRNTKVFLRYKCVLKNGDYKANIIFLVKWESLYCEIHIINWMSFVQLELFGVLSFKG